MRYGKVVNGEITNWIDIKPGDALKVQKAIAHGYRPEEDIRPDSTEYERLQAIGHDIQASKLVKLYQVVSKSAEDVAAIDEAKAKAEAVSTNLPGWSTVDAAIDNIASLADAKAFLKKLTRACYVHIKNSLI